MKKYIILLFLLLLFISISAISYAEEISSNISGSVFRLHVIANSDSSYDQELKFKVRDCIIEYMNSISNGCNTKSDIINLAKENLEVIKQKAKEVVVANGYNYDIAVSIGNYEFPTKNYGDISLPAGLYDALKIQIGNAEGQNWWCVMFPPLCFIDVTSGVVPEESKELIKDELSDEEYSVISKNTPDVKFKFKLLELFSDITSTFTSIASST